MDAATEEAVATGAAAGILGGMFVFFAIFGLIFFVLLVIAYWKMFTKAGVEGWKSIIPVYNTYTLYKLVWNVQNFWIYLGLTIVTYLFSGINSDGSNMFLSILTLVAGIALLVWIVRANIATAKAYGKGTGFAVGLTLLPNIFTLILGFGDARYVGPQEA